MRWSIEVARTLRYRQQIDHMHARYAGTARIHELTHDGVAFASVVQDQAAVARMLARAVGRGRYQPSPARVKTVTLDKPRDLYSFEALDFIVHGVVGQLLTELVEPLLSPSVYSYRRRASPAGALGKFAAFVRAHRAAVADPKERGLYVLRGDVRKYIESVPLDARSPLWPELRALTGLAEDDPHWRLVERIARPEVYDSDERVLFCRRAGLPMGSPAVTALLNLYLRPIDEALDALGGFYARFGDDLLFAHADPDRLRAAVRAVDEGLAARGLTINVQKRRTLFFNGAGRPSAAWPELDGAAEVRFLGASVRFDGTTGLPRDKWRELLIDLRRRLGRCRALLGDAPLDERAVAMCAVVNEALDPRSALAHRHAPALRTMVNDRRQLAELDYLVARWIAEMLTGEPSVRALRRVPWQRMRSDFGLASQVALRNGA
jgi:hypothetical protein